MNDSSLVTDLNRPRRQKNTEEFGSSLCFCFREKISPFSDPTKITLLDPNPL